MACLLQPLGEYRWQMTDEEVCSCVEDAYNTYVWRPHLGEDAKYDVSCAFKVENGLWNVTLQKNVGLQRVTVNVIFDEKTKSIGAPELPN